MLSVYQMGGWCGLVIVILSFMGIYAAVRGLVLSALFKRRLVSDASWGSLIEKKVLSARSEDRQMVLSALMRSEFSGIYSSSYFLKLCAAVGPLAGLLGTVLGMVEVFSSISDGSNVNPALLAGGIWKALITTVMGLCLAIPSMIVAWFLQARLRLLRTTLMLKICNLDKL